MTDQKNECSESVAVQMRKAGSKIFKNFSSKQRSGVFYATFCETIGLVMFSSNTATFLWLLRESDFFEGS